MNQAVLLPSSGQKNQARAAELTQVYNLRIQVACTVNAQLAAQEYTWFLEHFREPPGEFDENYSLAMPSEIPSTAQLAVQATDRVLRELGLPIDAVLEALASRNTSAS